MSSAKRMIEYTPEDKRKLYYPEGIEAGAGQGLFKSCLERTRGAVDCIMKATTRDEMDVCNQQNMGLGVAPSAPPSAP